MRAPGVGAVGILLAVAGSAACAVDLQSRGVELREERTLAVAGGDLALTVETFDGAISVRSWDRNEVRAEIVRRANDTERAEALTVDVSIDGNRIAIEAPSPPAGRPEVVIGPWTSESVSFVLTVPRELASLRARSEDGRIDVDGVAGTIELESDDGAVTGAGLQGDIVVRTSDGSIQLADVDGRLAARTSDGSVRLDGRFDGLTVDTSDGSVQVAVVDGSVMQDDWSISTSDGSIRLSLPASFDAAIEARTGDGRIRVEGVGADTGDERRRELRATLGDGGRRLRLQSGDGSITVGRP